MSEQLVVVTIEWDGPDGRQAEAFGPWAVCEDGQHIVEIADFAKRWHARESKPGVSATLWKLKSPQAYDERAAGT